VRENYHALSAVRLITADSHAATHDVILALRHGRAYRGRLSNHDYARDGAYFLTICAYRRRRLLVDDVCRAIERELVALPDRFDGLSLDCWKVLPNHLHAIVTLSKCPSTVSAIVQAFKSLTTRQAKRIASIDRLWQRGFYDRIIRSETELMARREYAQQRSHSCESTLRNVGAELARPLRPHH
jgi:putative transposase